jgi:hypothetical protein
MANNNEKDLTVVLFTKELMESLFQKYNLEAFADEAKLFDYLKGEKVYLGVEMALALAMLDYEDIQSERGTLGRLNILCAEKNLALLRDALMLMFGNDAMCSACGKSVGKIRPPSGDPQPGSGEKPVYTCDDCF